VIEQPVEGGSVDVGLERSGERIACEISVTSTDVQELGNMKKCLSAGFQEVIICSPDTRNMEKQRALAAREITAADQQRLFFMQPDEIILYLKKKAKDANDDVRTVKGYRVRVSYRHGLEKDQKTKQETVAQVIAGALHRKRR